MGSEVGVQCFSFIVESYERIIQERLRKSFGVFRKYFPFNYSLKHGLQGQEKAWSWHQGLTHSSHWLAFLPRVFSILFQSLCLYSFIFCPLFFFLFPDLIYQLSMSSKLKVPLDAKSKLHSLFLCNEEVSDRK